MEKSLATLAALGVLALTTLSGPASNPGECRLIGEGHTLPREIVSGNDQRV